MYFQRGNSSMGGKTGWWTSARSRFAARPQEWGCRVVRSRGLQASLRQNDRDRGALELHVHAAGDLDRDERIAEVGQAAGETAVGHDLVALLQLREQLAV